MYKQNVINATTIKRNTSVEGEPLEAKIERIVHNNEPIKDGAPKIYTDRKDGVMKDYNPRTDKWEVAIDAMDKVAEAKRNKRQELLTEREQKDKPKIKEKDNVVEPTGGTPTNTPEGNNG